MQNQDWDKFGEDISRTVQDAIDSQNFNRLNQTVTNTINNAMNNLGKSIQNVGDIVDKTARSFQPRSHSTGGGAYRYRGSSAQEAYRADAWKERKQAEQSAGAGGYGQEALSIQQRKPGLFIRTSGTKAAGILMSVAGYAIGITMLVVCGGIIIGAAFTPGVVQTGLLVLAILTGLITIGGGILGGAGTSLLKSLKRYRIYLRELGEKEYCDIKRLSECLDKSQKYIVRDIEKMIHKGWFSQGHLDNQKTCLIVSNEAYEQYHNLMDRIEKQKQEEQRLREQQFKEQKETDPQVQEVIRTGDAYIRKIHECNDAIPGEEISAKISRMEVLVKRIFDRVRQNPESVADIRKLMEYYLPTTVKLLEAYEELDAVPVQGENILSSKGEIEKTLDTLNVAFEKLLDSLFQETAWDVASDISVLNMMLAQEGLTKDDF